MKEIFKEDFFKLWAKHKIIFARLPDSKAKRNVFGELFAVENQEENKKYTIDETFFEDLTDIDTIFINNIEHLKDVSMQKMLQQLIKTSDDLHFVFTTNSILPKWLEPFEFAGVLTVVPMDSPQISVETIQFFVDMLKSLKDKRQLKIFFDKDEEHSMIFAKYKIGKSLFQTELTEDMVFEYYVQFEENIYNKFAPKEQEILLKFSLFDSFNVKLAQIVSGDINIAKKLNNLILITDKILFKTSDTYKFTRQFKRFLMWKIKQVYSKEDINAIYTQLAEHFEFNGEYTDALEYYSKTLDYSKIISLIKKSTKKNPRMSHFYELEKYYLMLPDEKIKKSSTMMCDMSMLYALGFDWEKSQYWYNQLELMLAKTPKDSKKYHDIQSKIIYLDIALPQRGSKNTFNFLIKSIRLFINKGESLRPFSITSSLPSVINGGKDFTRFLKKDYKLYFVLKRPVEIILGKDGVGILDCAYCESKIEKGEDFYNQLLKVMSKLGDIQSRGSFDIEFVAMSIIAKAQIIKNEPNGAIDTLISVKNRFEKMGEKSFTGNIDAFICRINLMQGEMKKANEWLSEKAPKVPSKIICIQRYQYLTMAMVLVAKGEYHGAMLIMAQFNDYFELCERTKDIITIKTLTAICYYRLGDDVWKEYVNKALDLCYENSLVMVVARLGCAILPLLKECGWSKSQEFLEKMTTETRKIAVYYPLFLKEKKRLIEPLTETETQVLHLLCQNMSNNDICEILDIKLATTKTHVSRVLSKIGVSRRVEVKERAIELGIIKE